MISVDNYVDRGVNKFHKKISKKTNKQFCAYVLDFSDTLEFQAFLQKIFQKNLFKSSNTLAIAKKIDTWLQVIRNFLCIATRVVPWYCLRSEKDARSSRRLGDGS